MYMYSVSQKNRTATINCMQKAYIVITFGAEKSIFPK